MSLNVHTISLLSLISMFRLLNAESLQPLTDAEADAIILAQETANAEKKTALRAKLDSADILSEGETILDNGQRVIVREVRPPQNVGPQFTEAASLEPNTTQTPTPEQLAAFQQAQSKEQQSLHLSVSLHESCSYIRWQHESADYAIVSPINWRHLSGLFSVESETASYLILMGIGPATRDVAVPDVSELALDSYIVAEGDPSNSPAFAGIETLVDFYLDNAEHLQSQTQRREALAAARQRYEAAHPKSDVPEDFVFQFWIPEKQSKANKVEVTER